MEELELSIVIPHYNDPAGLAECLATLEAQTYDKSRFEVIVCDNNSKEAVVGLDAYNLTVSLVVETARGAGPARNAGAAIAKGKFLAFTDCDCLLDPDFVKNGLNHMRDEGERSVMAGEIIIYPEHDRPNSVEAFEITYSMDQEGYTKKGDAATGNMWTSRALFEEVGTFHADVAEDTDWCQRAYAIGAKFHFGGDCIAKHPARATLDELRAKWKRQSAMTFNMWKKEPGFALKWPALCVATAVSAVPHSIRALKDRKLPYFADKLKSILILFWCRFFRAKIMVGFYFSGLDHIDPNKYWTNT
ncbi:glycosyltransferase [Sneathiella sp. HT1-7]|uniref:glycosyltransferase n=1 Tax=Sneathiella sp. HT1-7 TaxID=2887192 RepID=UPI001D13A859|nr:glycosyltransferase [Sneathiella sp. HT1-7]MCC3303885.1 glycosyltransferase family 2 protein [Sneathiella sp. HT1-7]